MAKRKNSNQLTRQETVFIRVYEGNQVEAAELAGYKDPKKMGSIVYNRRRVKAAIEKKMQAAVKASGKALGNKITVGRNDIVNRLDDLSQNAASDSAKVAALRELKEIFGMKPSDAKGDIFAGWTEEEMDEFIQTGRYPAWLVSPTPEK